MQMEIAISYTFIEQAVCRHLGVLYTEASRGVNASVRCWEIRIVLESVHCDLQSNW